MRYEGKIRGHLTGDGSDRGPALAVIYTYGGMLQRALGSQLGACFVIKVAPVLALTILAPW